MNLPDSMTCSVIRRGQIFLSSMFNDIDHNKFFVVIGVTATEIVGFFYVNSKINTYCVNKPEQIFLQYHISPDDYGFLHHDSYICATSLIVRSKADIMDSINRGKTKLIDCLKSEHLDEILDMVRASKLYSKRDKEMYFYK